ncbi:glycosyltransferase family 2 protein [Solimonas soli]|uniref:glycosyltransferase family 2 protein n=1 Tax=Solimonas soli TaxID=413479 RepID=UPI00048A0003|nr:glycosyltransferase family A protein [Solimonas soli]
MKVSVIVPVFNRAAMIGGALRSILREAAHAELDIIVIDDGSTDDSAAVVEALVPAHPQIRLFRQSNRGVTAARNAGLARLPADADAVTFLDSDDAWAPGRLADLALLAAAPDAAFCYGRMAIVAALDAETLAPDPADVVATLRGVHLGVALFRPWLLARLGGFDESYRQSEDLDFLMRAFECRVPHVLSERVAMYYRRHPGNMTGRRDEARRDFARALHGSMRRRRADPSLGSIAEVIDMGDLARRGFR